MMLLMIPAPGIPKIKTLHLVDLFSPHERVRSVPGATGTARLALEETHGKQRVSPARFVKEPGGHLLQPWVDAFHR